MKRFLFTLIAGFATVGLMAYSAPPNSGIKGSDHDLSVSGPNTVTADTETCRFCHSPHNAAASTAQLVPLWNHQTSTATFKMYSTSSEASNITGTFDSSPTGTSLACLSCHDGTLAVGALLNYPYGTSAEIYTTAKGNVDPTTGLMINGSKVGTDLSNDHPIGITYQDDKDAGLKTAAGLVGVKLFPSNTTGSKVQCASCHDVHNWALSPITSLGGAPFLRVANTASALCTSCHKK